MFFYKCTDLDPAELPDVEVPLIDFLKPEYNDSLGNDLIKDGECL